MSASLVGSEMCIRDSPRGAGSLEEGGGGAAALGRRRLHEIGLSKIKQKLPQSCCAVQECAVGPSIQLL
eukprot:6376819-Alexandrium_andersonii.AAC.1